MAPVPASAIPGPSLLCICDLHGCLKATGHIGLEVTLLQHNFILTYDICQDLSKQGHSEWTEIWGDIINPVYHVHRPMSALLSVLAVPPLQVGNGEGAMKTE
jgi:hypothetical protein